MCVMFSTRYYNMVRLVYEHIKLPNVIIKFQTGKPVEPY